jgi:hypothetical protein
VKPERARGLQLYAIAALVLIGGGVWFVRAEPRLGVDPRLAGWRETVTHALPDVQPQIDSDTVVLGTGSEQQATAPVPGGSFTLSMICAGSGYVRVRVSTGNDTGLAVACATRPQLVTITVGLGPQFFLSMESASRAAVFRWRLTSATTY